jgi:hypothetical protein
MAVEKVESMTILMPKAAALGDLPDVFKSGYSVARHHYQQLHQLQRFLERANRMVAIECPEFQHHTSRVSSVFNEAFAHERAIADAERRLADDLSDVAARYDVLVRLFNELTDAKKKLASCREREAASKRNLADDIRHGGMKQYIFEADIRGALEEKRRVVDFTIAKMEEYIAARDSYFKFTVRRMKHAFSNMGEALRNSGDGILQNCRQIKGAVRFLRQNVDAIQDKAAPQPVTAADDEGEEYEEEQPEEEDQERAVSKDAKPGEPPTTPKPSAGDRADQKEESAQEEEYEEEDQN